MYTGSETSPTGRFSGEKAVVATLIVTAAIASIILFFLDPVRVPIYPVCLFHSVTGLDCPGCGGLRATHALLHGDIIAAVHFNAMVVLSALLFVVMSLFYVFRKIQNRPTPIRWNWLWIYFGVWLLFSVLRDLPIPLFAAFAP